MNDSVLLLQEVKIRAFVVREAQNWHDRTRREQAWTWRVGEWEENAGERKKVQEDQFVQFSLSAVGPSSSSPPACAGRTPDSQYFRSDFISSFGNQNSQHILVTDSNSSRSCSSSASQTFSTTKSLQFSFQIILPDISYNVWGRTGFIANYNLITKGLTIPGRVLAEVPQVVSCRWWQPHMWWCWLWLRPPSPGWRSCPGCRWGRGTWGTSRT